MGAPCGGPSFFFSEGELCAGSAFMALLVLSTEHRNGSMQGRGMPGIRAIWESETCQQLGEKIEHSQ